MYNITLTHGHVCPWSGVLHLCGPTCDYCRLLVRALAHIVLFVASFSSHIYIYIYIYIVLHLCGPTCDYCRLFVRALAHIVLLASFYSHTHTNRERERERERESFQLSPSYSSLCTCLLRVLRVIC
jgi:hypothetical protein